jgi:hypothetical protein
VWRDEGEEDIDKPLYGRTIGGKYWTSRKKKVVKGEEGSRRILWMTERRNEQATRCMRERWM